MNGESVWLRDEFGWTELHRWRYVGCHASREATQRILKLADGRFAVWLAASDDGFAWNDLDTALLSAEQDRARWHANQVAHPYNGPGPAVGEWVEQAPGGGARTRASDHHRSQT